MAATSPPQLMVFELYYGDTLVAADFAHPSCGGTGVYVATRFSARGHSTTSSGLESATLSEEDAHAIRTMQPGFILALIECRWLQERGCQLWDLGGYNLSPLMQYKLDLAGPPQQRPHALHEFRSCVKKRNGTTHLWMESMSEAGGGTDAADNSSLFSGVRSGDVLAGDVQIHHLLGQDRA